MKEREGFKEIFLNYPDYAFPLVLDFIWLEQARVNFSFPAVFHVCLMKEQLIPVSKISSKVDNSLNVQIRLITLAQIGPLADQMAL